MCALAAQDIFPRLQETRKQGEQSNSGIAQQTSTNSETIRKGLQQQHKHSYAKQQTCPYMICVWQPLSMNIQVEQLTMRKGSSTHLIRVLTVLVSYLSREGGKRNRKGPLAIANVTLTFPTLVCLTGACGGAWCHPGYDLQHTGSADEMQHNAVLV